MKRFLKVRIVSTCLSAVALLALAGAPAAFGQASSSDAAVTRPDTDATRAIVLLKGDPLSLAASTKPPQGNKIDFNSTAVKSYRARLSALRNDFKAWLRANAPAANVTHTFDISLNAVSVDLNGTSLDLIKQAPQVLDAQPEGLYYPSVDDPDLGLIKAVQAWQVGGGPANAGADVKVAIIDTGIDVNHPCFSDAGYPAQKQLGDHRFTNNKVIAAKVFNNRIPTQGYTAQAIQEHGTHVAGTVGCNFGTPATVEGVTIPYLVSGVAPRVLLGNYNVFPATVSNARSEDIFQALEEAYEDGFDVANMSLGGGAKGVSDLVSAAVDHLDRANMVVAVAAGNSGPGYFTVESPGRAARALTAGASTVPHFVGAHVTANGTTYGAAVGDFATPAANLTAPLAVVLNSGSLTKGCAAFPAGSLAGKIALISRGTCSFSTKIRDAQNAGALAALIVNNVIGDPIAMGQDGTPNQPTIPAVMLSKADGAAFIGLNGASVTISSALFYIQTPNADFMASFSSWGPTPVDFRIKPDVVAPGVNVLSSIPLAYCGGASCWAFFQGTSMATPHLAGGAAVLRSFYPEWSAAEIRSAIVNTANRHVLKDWVVGAPLNDVNIVGTGREDLLAAVNASVALDPVSISFGGVPTGSGQTQPFAVMLTSLRAVAVTYSLGILGGDPDVSYSVSPSTITLQPGGTGTVTVTMSAVKGAALGLHEGIVTLSNAGTEVAHAGILTVIK
jgi:subtilisin family serine protease